MSSPTYKDYQINPKATVERWGEHEFFVDDLLIRPWRNSTWTHHLSADCPSCHCALKVYLRSTCDAPKFIQEEACRLAIQKHLRTEHKSPKHVPSPVVRKAATAADLIDRAKPKR
jgi:hypothetical protein